MKERSLWSVFNAVVAVAALIVASIAVAKAGDENGPGKSLAGGGEPVAAEDTMAEDTMAEEPPAEESATSGPTTVEVDLTEFALKPKTVEVPAGDIVLKAVNKGAIPHTLAFDKGKPVTSELKGGESEDLKLNDIKPGTYKLFCNVPGHESAGMKGELKVAAAKGGAAKPAAKTAGSTGKWADLDKIMQDSIKKFPAKTKGVGAKILEPTILEDGTKEFHLTAKIVDWEVSPGKKVKAWTYNGMVPAPTIKLDVGDNVKVVLKNELPMGTDIHWHGVRVPNDQDGVSPLTQKLIEAGATYTYQFQVVEPAIAMYHPHHHAQMQVINGMLGMVQVGSVPLPAGRTVGGRAVPAGLVPAQEFPMVLNDAGEIGYSLNGKSFPATAPVAAKQGEWILVHYINEGLQIHPMHAHGAPGLVVAKEGNPLDSPYWADTVNVAPGERISVLIEARDKGVWAWHCHILTHAESEDGMFGMVTALIVE